MAAKGVGVPMLEECAGVGVQEMGKPPNGVCGAVRAVMMVPTRHLALVLVATHVWGDAKYGLMDIAVTKAAVSITGAVLDLVVGL